MATKAPAMHAPEWHVLSKERCLMKRNNDGNDKHVIHRRGARGLWLLATITLFILVACSGQAPTAEPATSPVVLTETVATPTLMPATAAPTQASASATPLATQTMPPTGTVPSPTATSTQDASSGVQDLVTYEDNVAYFALDYPAAWHVIDVAQEDKVGMPGYILTFLSWDPAAGIEEIPTGESIVEANVQPRDDASLEEAAESLKASLGTRQTIISENMVTLDSGLPAMRWLLDTQAGPTYVLLAIVVDRPVMLRGWGDEGIFDLVAGSLRATYTQADDAERIVFAPGATSATVQGSFSGQDQARYLFWAAEGQVVSLTVTSPQNSVLFHLEGVQDGQVYKHLLDGEISWQGALTVSQDYLLTIDNSDMPADYTIDLSVVDG